MVKTNLYQIGASMIRNIGGDIGRTLRRNFYKFAGVQMGVGVKIHENVVIYRPYNLEIGDGTEIGTGAIISSRKKIKIGKHVGIGPQSSIYDNDHKMPLGPREEDMIDSSIEISDGAWIGTRAVVLRGVKIGKNAVIGAGSVVNKNIPDNAVASGNPAKIIKYNRIPEDKHEI
jgi:acetyltransferase-like isoleucine patch superfamily enzyme